MSAPSRAVLRQPESYPESRLPPGVQRLRAAAALGRAVYLAFLRWEKRVAPTERFWRDFGFAHRHSSDARLVARGTGTAPCIAIASAAGAPLRRRRRSAMSDDTDLEVYVRRFGARRLAPELRSPAADRRRVARPVGTQRLAAAGPGANSTRCPPASRYAARQHAAARTAGQPHRPHADRAGARRAPRPLGAADRGLPGMADWYIRVLGLIPTDVQYLADGSPTLAFCRLDLGDTAGRPSHGGLRGRHRGQVRAQRLRGRGPRRARPGPAGAARAGHRHMWGIGRHLLGSQLFDYWFDPDGFEYEHYADGDVFTADFETYYSPLEFGGIWAWGDDAPASMKPGKNLRTLLRVLKLLRRRRITPQRLKLLGAALDAPARPWL